MGRTSLAHQFPRLLAVALAALAAVVLAAGLTPSTSSAAAHSVPRAHAAATHKATPKARAAAARCAARARAARLRRAVRRMRVLHCNAAHVARAASVRRECAKLRAIARAARHHRTKKKKTTKRKTAPKKPVPGNINPPGSTPAPQPGNPTGTTASWPQGPCQGPFSAGNWPGACWRPYGPTSPFNTQIAADAVVAPDSSAMVNRMLSWGAPTGLTVGGSSTQWDYYHPVYYAQNSDPVFTLHAVEDWGPNPVQGMQIHIPDAARPATGDDAHMAVVEPDGWEYDFWQVRSKPAGGGTLVFSWGGRLRIDGDGLGGEATASGFGLMAGMIRPEELAAGHIDHALFGVVKCTNPNGGFGFGEKVPTNGTSAYVYPADDGGSSCSGADAADAPPMGAHIQLAMSDAQIQALPVPDYKKTVLTAMAHYGVFIGDTGGSGFSVMMQSGATYTSFGVKDPTVTFAQQQGVKPYAAGLYDLDLPSGVDWQRYLRVVAPPASA